jgi:hypothetical protein
VDATRKSEANPAEGATHGYIKAKDKERLENRLRRIEGQVRGVVFAHPLDRFGDPSRNRAVYEDHAASGIS